MEIVDSETDHVICTSCSVYGNSTSAGQLNCAASFDFIRHRAGINVIGVHKHKISEEPVLLLMLPFGHVSSLPWAP